MTDYEMMIYLMQKTGDTFCCEETENGKTIIGNNPWGHEEIYIEFDDKGELLPS